MANSLFSITGLARFLRGNRHSHKAFQTILPPAPDPAQYLMEEREASVGAILLDTLRIQLKDAEAQAADALAKTIDLKARQRKQEEASERQLAHLNLTCEKLAQELKQTKEALATGQASQTPADSRIFLSALVASTRDAVCVIDQKGDFLSWNRAAEAIFGYSPQESVGLTAPLLIAHDSRASFQKAMEGIGCERACALDIHGIRKDGSVFPIEVVLASWTEGEHKRFVLITHDASRRRETETMRRDKDAAEEANRAKSQFLANMSHELRTPLNAIIGFSEILHDRTFGELTPKQERYVGNILSSGRHLLQLINDILDLSKIEAGRVQLEYAAFSPLTAVRTVDNLVKALLQKKNITLEIEAESSLPPLLADQGKFKQILYNLISNAIKFTPESGKVTVSLGTSGGGSLLQVDVKDTGIGIKLEDQARIFNEFEQVDNSYSRQQQGTGLGLALVRKFIELHGGRIWIASSGDGEGTTFRFTIPFSPNSDPSGGNDKGSKTTRLAIAENPTPAAAKQMALVVGADAAAAEMLTHQLQDKGYDVARAARAEETLSLARELKPALILLDIQSAGASGWAALKGLKSDKALENVPVIVIATTAERDQALLRGALSVLTKPLEHQTLQKTLMALQGGGVRPQRGRSARMAA